MQGEDNGGDGDVCIAYQEMPAFLQKMEINKENIPSQELLVTLPKFYG